MLAADPTACQLRCRHSLWSHVRAVGFAFSVNLTTDMLYSVVTPEQKYKTKNFIDTGNLTDLATVLHGLERQSGYCNHRYSLEYLLLMLPFAIGCFSSSSGFMARPRLSAQGEIPQGDRNRMSYWTRREFISAGAALAALPAMAGETAMIRRSIPSSGEELPVIGLGTYSVFDVASTPEVIASRKAIVDKLVEASGSVIDTSPMYNRSERVIGDIVRAGSERSKLFLATKVWIDGRDAGLAQMRRSAELMNTDVIDLMQVHNLRDTALHMASIREWQEDGLIRYNGLTHYTAGAHRALENEMRTFEPQFIQINYSLGEREAEDRILPLAREMGIAVLINRPFQSGRLFSAVSGRALPEWASDFADSWGQFFLKFIVSHPAVTCAIPATSKIHHMVDNLGAGVGVMPDAAMRQRMIDYFADL